MVGCDIIYHQLVREQLLEYFVNLPSNRFNDPGIWAAEMEALGWQGICASDHFWIGESRYPHVFVTATRMACATSRIKLTTSFCNNLFRSPVEFAQATLALQQASNGRFEAGLGAGWAEEEMTAIGLQYPDGPTRMSRYIEAIKVVRSLIETGQCQFAGDHYDIDRTGSKAVGPVSSKPSPLIGSVGGPRGMREVTPLVDRIEIKASARGTRVGYIDINIMATVTEDEIRRNIDSVKAINPEMPLSIFILSAVGDNPAVNGMKSAYGEGYLGNFHGHPDDVARSLESLSAIGIDRVQLTEMAPGSHEALANSLLP